MCTVAIYHKSNRTVREETWVLGTVTSGMMDGIFTSDLEDLQEDKDDGEDKYYCTFISSITDKLLQ